MKRHRLEQNDLVVRCKRNKLSEIPRAPCSVDGLAGLPYRPTPPLPAKNYAMYIVGSPGSGKTNLWVSMMTSKKPRYYRGLYDLIYLISGSLDTLPKKVVDSKKGVPKDQQFRQLVDEELIELLDTLKNGDNTNNLLILDDVIRDMTRSRVLSKVFLNRRHITHSGDKDEGQGSLSIITTSQKYNLLPLEFRTAMSHVIVFKTENASELRAIREELMQDLNPEQQDRLLASAWDKPYSFLTIVSNAPRGQRYFIRFDPVIDISKED